MNKKLNILGISYFQTVFAKVVDLVLDFSGVTRKLIVIIYFFQMKQFLLSYWIQDGVSF